MRRLCSGLLSTVVLFAGQLFGQADAADLDAAIALPPPLPVCDPVVCPPVGGIVLVSPPVYFVPPPTVLDVYDDRNGYNQ